MIERPFLRLWLPLAVAVALTFVAAVSLVSGADPGRSGIAVEQAWARATAGSATTGAAFLRIANRGAADDRLLAVECSASDRATIHSGTRAGAVMQMRPAAEGLTIAAGTVLDLRPGGDHIMLTGLRQPLRRGETVPLTLIFDKAGRVETQLVVAAAGARAPDAGADRSPPPATAKAAGA